MRFLFRPADAEASGLRDLPWERPLVDWPPDLLLDVPRRGISRHEVRFVASGEHVFALKEIDERLARHEDRLLREFEREGLPTITVLGTCVDRPAGQDAILVTRYLQRSASYRWVFCAPRGRQSVEELLDPMVALLVRLHLAGIFWGDCSLSNTLLRADDGVPVAYLVDAETVERHASLSDGQRSYDLDLASERVGAELLDLRFGGLLPPDIDPIAVAEGLSPRYAARWDEVTRTEGVGGESRHPTAARPRRPTMPAPTWVRPG